MFTNIYINRVIRRSFIFFIIACSSLLQAQEASKLAGTHKAQAPISKSSSLLEQFLRNVRENAAMVQTKSGLLIHIMAPGAGARARPQDAVVVTLSAKGPQGSDLPQFKLRSARMKVADLMPGLAEGVQMTALGGRALLMLPPSLSFGSGQWPNGIARAHPFFCWSM